MEELRAKAREYRAKHWTGRKPRECRVCHLAFVPINSNQKYCVFCKPAVQREWYRKNAALFRQRHPEQVRETQRRSIEKRKEHYLAMDSLYASRVNAIARRKVFEHYSGGTSRCACCGESEIDFLTIDHVNNDGAKQRLEVFGRRDRGGVLFYRWLVKNRFPPGMAVLCMSCNLSKAKHGICVHQMKQSVSPGPRCYH